MKKVIVLIIMFLVLTLYLNKYNSNFYIIPDEAIRIRIIANSDSAKDQYVKIKTKQYIEPIIEKDLKSSKSMNQSRKIIKDNINNYQKQLNKYLLNNGYNSNFEILYGNNYFPEKEYKGVKYKSGNYESLVIKLGKAEGENWWCVLFPPICSLEVEENDDIEYKIYVKEVFNKYLSK